MKKTTTKKSVMLINYETMTASIVLDGTDPEAELDILVNVDKSDVLAYLRGELITIDHSHCNKLDKCYYQTACAKYGDPLATIDDINEIEILDTESMFDSVCNFFAR